MIFDLTEEQVRNIATSFTQDCYVIESRMSATLYELQINPVQYRRKDNESLLEISIAYDKKYTFYIEEYVGFEKPIILSMSHSRYLRLPIQEFLDKYVR